MNDPFPPKDIDYSMHTESDLPKVVRHEDFHKLSHDEKLEILTDEMLVRGDDYPIEVMVEDAGIGWKAYKELITFPDYMRLIKEKALNENVAPKIPRIYENQAIEAANGDAAAVKTVLGLIGALAPETAIQINQNIMNLTDAELKLEMEKELRGMD